MEQSPRRPPFFLFSTFAFGTRYGLPLLCLPPHRHLPGTATLIHLHIPLPGESDRPSRHLAPSPCGLSDHAARGEG